MAIPNLSAHDYDLLGWRVRRRAEGSSVNRADLIVAIAVTVVSLANFAGLLWDTVGALRS